MTDPLDNFLVVLVSPLYGGNVGAVCRAMLNMGLSRLALAAPRSDWDAVDARRRAYRAVEVLEAREEYPTLAEAVAGCAWVAGATARSGLYRAHARSAREWAPRLLEAAATERVALVFGPEDKGLSNDDLALCTQIIQIPSSERYPSLNLSHAVMVCCYEIYLASGRFDERAAEEASPLAPSTLRERLFALWREALLDIGFMNEEKAGHMMMGLRRILSRGALTVADAKILMGIARQARWCAERLPEPVRRGTPAGTNERDNRESPPYAEPDADAGGGALREEGKK